MQTYTYPSGSFNDTKSTYSKISRTKFACPRRQIDITQAKCISATTPTYESPGVRVHILHLTTHRTHSTVDHSYTFPGAYILKG